MQIRDWLYVEDHCNAIQLILENGHIWEHCKILGSCEGNNKQIIRMVCNVLDELKPRADNWSYKNQLVYTKDRIGHDYRYSLGISKIKKELCWEPSEMLQRGFKKNCSMVYLINRSWINQPT